MVAPIPREKLTQDLQRVASKLDEPPSEGQYSEHGEHSVSALRREFGGMPDAREAAGLDSSDQRGGQNRASREALLQAIHDLCDELGHTPRRDEMLECGDFSEKPYTREFGSWAQAVVEAGYKPRGQSRHTADYVTASCNWCGDTEEVLASQRDNQNNWYCSRECFAEWRAENIVGEDHHQYNRVSVTCDHCGDSFNRRPSIVEDRELHFCDTDCFGSWCSEQRTGEAHPRWTGGGVEIECEVCGDTRTVKQAKTANSRFCSPECMGKAKEEEQTGSDNPNWIEGTTTYYGPNWETQRKKRLEKDDYACIVCGTSRQEHQTEFGQDLIVHHVTPRRKFVTDGELDAEQANRVSNLRTLCVMHHSRWEGIPVAPDPE